MAKGGTQSCHVHEMEKSDKGQMAHVSYTCMTALFLHIIVSKYLVGL